MADEIDWDIDIWGVIDSYFTNTPNYLSHHQIESYNTFLDTNISKTVRQFNPIVLPYSKILGADLNETDDYLFQVKITIGGSISDIGGEKVVINDGTSIYIGKPVIQEVKEDPDSDGNIVYRKTLYPNEARLKNITYTCGIRADVFIEFLVRDEDGLMKRSPQFGLREFKNVQLTNKLPIMLHSKICSLSGAKDGALRIMGECEYDQGGYFIIDGKEKVIVAQERQIENVTYLNKKKPEDRYKYVSEIRSAPENKLQPARITKCVILNAIDSQKEIIEENAIRAIVPNIVGEIPIFILLRALGVTSDYDICKIIVNQFDGTINKKMLDILAASIKEGSIITNQRDSLLFLEKRINPNFMNSGAAENKRKHFLANILKDYLLPHAGSNYYTKAYFIGHMVKELLIKFINNAPSTDRDSYLYKRVDISGFLMSAIFRDLFFRVKNKLMETLNIFYTTKEGENQNIYWNQYSNQSESSLLEKNFRIYNIISSAIDDVDGGLPISTLVDQSIMDEGFMYAFKNCWGLKNARGCKQGVTQDMNRLSYLGAVSHIRRVNTPLSASAKVRAPHSLHLSSFGIMCPDETPDGGNVGLRKNISLFANITSGTNSENLLRLLFSSGVEDILQIETDKLIHTKVFLNERFIGYTKRPYYLNRKLKLLKRNALINVYTSISWQIENNIMKISTDSGRGVRPVLVVNKGSLMLTKDILEKISDISVNYNWYHLVGGTRNIDNPKPYSNTDGNYYITDREDDLDYLESTAGIIEFIDPAESNNSLIAMYPRDLTTTIDKYSYCEIHPAINFGVLASAIPGIEMNQHPRNQFSTGQAKQALGVYATNFRNRMDTKGQIMYYPQRPVIKSKLAKYLRVDELPHGFNTIVAVGSYSGYNQEDSIIFNKSSVERGMFKTTKFRTFSQREEMKGDKKIEFICNPDPGQVTNMKSGNYNKLDSNGIVATNTKVNENDVLIGKCIYSGLFDANGEESVLDNSEFVKNNEEGFVDRVYSHSGNNNQRYVKVRIRKDKLPEVGDKFCSRHGQKGTIGMLLPACDMPRTKEGITPDIIVNPHAFPSRMTIAQFFETLLGKSCVHKGFLSEIVPFSENNIENVSKILQDNCGYEKHGNEVLYSGITGQQLKVNFFIGPTYYQRLTHQVSDKYQARDDGLKTALTHQPVGGRALGGGGRIGEMERDGLLSHGVSSFIKESYMERSDKYKFYISTKTGLISSVNPEKGIFRDISNDETEQFIDDNNNMVKRPLSESSSEFVCIEAPYSFKLFLQEVESMSIAPRIVAESVIKAWKASQNSAIPSTYSVQKKQQLLQKTGTGGDHPLVKPLNHFHNNIKALLLKEVVRQNSNLIDVSVSNVSDIYKWQLAKYNTVLGVYSDVRSIEGVGGYKSELVNMKTHDTRAINMWAKQSNINIILGDMSKDLYNSDVADANNSEYRSQLSHELQRVGTHSFNAASAFFSIQQYFTESTKITKLLSNIRKSLNRRGYFIVTVLDGNKIYNKLKEKHGAGDQAKLTGAVLNNKTGKNDTIWTIETLSLDLTREYLHDDMNNGFNQKVKIAIKGQDIKEECLVPTGLLISLAAKQGFTLVPSDELSEKFSILNKASDSFADIYNRYIKVHTDDMDSSTLKDANNSAIKELSDLYRCIVFKVDNYKIITDHTYGQSDSDKCLEDAQKRIFTNSRYPLIKLSVPTALDVVLVNSYITERRALIGLMGNSSIDTTDNMFLKRPNILLTPIITDIDTKLSSSFYRTFTQNTYKNTINYIFNYIKIGVYVRILNSELVQFIPIINHNNNNKVPEIYNKLLNKNIEFSDNPEESDATSLIEYIHTKYSGARVEDIFKNYYGIKTHSSREELEKNCLNATFIQNEKELVNGGQYVIDGQTLLAGNTLFTLIENKVSKYRHILESVCIAKSGKLNNCEFIINVLDHPIVSVDTEDKLNNPYKDYLGDNSRPIDIRGNILPIIGEHSLDSFLDIPIPTPHHWDMVNKDITVATCSGIPSIPRHPYTMLIDSVGVILNMDTSNKREFIRNFKENINIPYTKSTYDGDDELGKYDYIWDIMLYNLTLPNIINNSTASWENTDNLNSILENAQYISGDSNDAGLDKFPIKSKVLLYIEGNGGSSDILSLLSKAGGILVILKSQDVVPGPWFGKLLKPFKFAAFVKGTPVNEHYIELENITDLRDAVKFIVDNPDICKTLIKNRHTLIDSIINKTTIIDYYELVINKIGKKMNTLQIAPDIFKDVLREPHTVVNMRIPSTLLSKLIGISGKNIKRLQNECSVKINITKDTNIQDGIEHTAISITGGTSGVIIAEETIKRDLLNTTTHYIDIPTTAVGFVIGNKGVNIKLLSDQLNAKIFMNEGDPTKLLKYFTSKYPEDDINTLIKTKTLVTIIANTDVIDTIESAILSLVNRRGNNNHALQIMSRIENKSLTAHFNNSYETDLLYNIDTYIQNDYETEQLSPYSPKEIGEVYQSPGAPVSEPPAVPRPTIVIPGIVPEGEEAEDSSWYKSPTVLPTTPIARTPTPVAPSGDASTTTDDIEQHRDNNSVLIAIPMDHEESPGAQMSGGGSVEPSHKMLGFITQLRTRLNEYIRRQNTISHMNYKIVLLSHDMCALSGKDIHARALSDFVGTDIIENILENNGNEMDNIYKLRFNKGCLYNIAGNIAINDNHIKTVLLHPAYYIPNDHLIAEYFKDPGTSVTQLTSDLSMLLITKDVFYKTSFPNHLWCGDHIDGIYKEILDFNNVRVRNIPDRRNLEWIQSPPKFGLDEYSVNSLTELDKVYHSHNNILRGKWYDINPIKIISQNCINYSVNLDFNTHPIFNVDNQLIWKTIPEVADGADASIKYISYLKAYLSRTLQVDIYNGVNANEAHTHTLGFKTDQWGEEDIINVLLRLQLILSIYKTYIITNNTTTIDLMKFNDFKVTMSPDNDIHVIFISNDKSELIPTLEVSISDITTQPLSNKNAITYKFADVSGFDYSKVSGPFESLVDALQTASHAKIDVSKTLEYERKRKRLPTANITIVKMGNTDVILDIATDSVKYLNLDDTRVYNKPLDADLIPLTEDDNEFLLVVKYKLGLLQTDIINIIANEFYSMDLVNKDIIIITGAHSNKIATVTDVRLSSIIAVVDGESVTIDINPSAPKDSIILLEDVLLDISDTKHIDHASRSAKIIGSYASKLIIQYDDNGVKTIIPKPKPKRRAGKSTAKRQQSDKSSDKQVLIKTIQIDSPKVLRPKSDESVDKISTTTSSSVATFSQGSAPTTPVSPVLPVSPTSGSSKIITLKPDTLAPPPGKATIDMDAFIMEKGSGSTRPTIELTDVPGLEKTKSLDAPGPNIIDWPNTPKQSQVHDNRMPEFCEHLATMKKIPDAEIIGRRKYIYDTLTAEFDIQPSDLLTGSSVELTKASSDKLMKKLLGDKFLVKLLELYDEVFLENKARRYADIHKCNIVVCFENRCTKTAGKCWPGKSASASCPTIKIQLSAKVFKLMMDKLGDSTKHAFGCKCNNILDCVQLIFEHEYIHAFIDCFCNINRNRDSIGNYTGETQPKTGHSKTFMSIVNNLFGHTTYFHQLLLTNYDT